MASGRCQVPLAEPGAAAGLGMVQGGEVPARHPAAPLPQWVHAGGPPRLRLPVPQVLREMPSAALVGFNVTKTWSVDVVSGGARVAVPRGRWWQGWHLDAVGWLSPAWPCSPSAPGAYRNI